MAMKGLDLKVLAIELEEDSRGIYYFFFLPFMKIMDSVDELQMKSDKYYIYLTFVICLYLPLHVSV